MSTDNEVRLANAVTEALDVIDELTAVGGVGLSKAGRVKVRDIKRTLIQANQPQQIGDGSGNEVVVTGALFMTLAQSGRLIDIAIPDAAPNTIEFGLDFMQSRYRITVTQAPEVES
jgi:hypothetical protein